MIIKKLAFDGNFNRFHAEISFNLFGLLILHATAITSDIHHIPYHRIWCVAICTHILWANKNFAISLATHTHTERDIWRTCHVPSVVCIIFSRIVASRQKQSNEYLRSKFCLDEFIKALPAYTPRHHHWSWCSACLCVYCNEETICAIFSNPTETKQTNMQTKPMNAHTHTQTKRERMEERKRKNELKLVGWVRTWNESYFK